MSIQIGVPLLAAIIGAIGYLIPNRGTKLFQYTFGVGLFFLVWKLSGVMVRW